MIKKSGSSYAVTLYPLGFPMKVVVNDSLPSASSGADKPMGATFGRLSPVLWPALTEKAVAKLIGNYDMIIGGFIDEGFRLLTGAPADAVKTASLSED